MRWNFASTQVSVWRAVALRSDPEMQRTLEMPRNLTSIMSKGRRRVSLLSWWRESLMQGFCCGASGREN
jgi:hypothetical protein